MISINFALRAIESRSRLKGATEGELLVLERGISEQSPRLRLPSPGWRFGSEDRGGMRMLNRRGKKEGWNWECKCDVVGSKERRVVVDVSMILFKLQTIQV